MTTTWRVTEPADATAVRLADDYIRDNLAILADAIEREHVFAGDSASAEGQHSPSGVGIVFVGTTDEITALQAAEASGAIAFDTTLNVIKTWDGSNWITRSYVLSAGDVLDTKLTVPGSFIDGRDPGHDGGKIDTLSERATYAVVATGTVANGNPVPTPDGFDKSDCGVFVHNQNQWNIHPGLVRWPWAIKCSVNPTTWVVQSAATGSNRGMGPPPEGSVGITVNYMVVGALHTP